MHHQLMNYWRKSTSNHWELLRIRWNAWLSQSVNHWKDHICMMSGSTPKLISRDWPKSLLCVLRILNWPKNQSNFGEQLKICQNNFFNYSHILFHRCVTVYTTSVTEVLKKFFMELKNVSECIQFLVYWIIFYTKHFIFNSQENHDLYQKVKENIKKCF